VGEGEEEGEWGRWVGKGNWAGSKKRRGKKEPSFLGREQSPKTSNGEETPTAGTQQGTRLRHHRLIKTS